MSEPRATLYSQKWREARGRVHAIEPAARPLFISILDHMEHGWHAFRPLREWYERNSEHAGTAHGDYLHLLDFVDGELSDVFLLIGVGVADLVPGWDGWAAEADPADLDGWTELFSRYLAVFRLACVGGDVPEPFRALGVSVVEVLESSRWTDELSALLAAVGELVPVGEE
ncbi:MAG TPA: hypothetical protein VF006_24085 [Longimicrobium sp.]